MVDIMQTGKTTFHWPELSPARWEQVMSSLQEGKRDREGWLCPGPRHEQQQQQQQVTSHLILSCEETDRGRFGGTCVSHSCSIPKVKELNLLITGYTEIT